MIKYKINVWDALQRAGINLYTAKKTGILGQATLKKIKNEDTSITLDTLNRLCTILDMQPKDIIIYIDDATEKEKILNKKST